MSDLESERRRRFHESMSGGSVWIRNSKKTKPLQPNNATKSAVRTIFAVGTIFETYDIDGVRHEYPNGAPRLVTVVKNNTRSCWLASLGVNEGVRYGWDIILAAYNRGQFQLYQQ